MSLACVCVPSCVTDPMLSQPSLMCNLLRVSLLVQVLVCWRPS
jgi:hypothetical protein